MGKAQNSRIGQSISAETEGDSYIPSQTDKLKWDKGLTPKGSWNPKTNTPNLSQTLLVDGDFLLVHELAENEVYFSPLLNYNVKNGDSIVRINGQFALDSKSAVPGNDTVGIDQLAGEVKELNRLLLGTIYEEENSTDVDGGVDLAGLAAWQVTEDGRFLVKGVDILALIKQIEASYGEVAPLKTALTQLAATVKSITDQYITVEESEDLDGGIDQSGLAAWQVTLKGIFLVKGKDILKIANEAHDLIPIVNAIQSVMPSLTALVNSYVEYDTDDLDGGVDMNGLAAWQIGPGGVFLVRGMDIRREILNLQQFKTLVPYVKPSLNIACWGDSLTAASYPQRLQTLFNNTRTVFNGGIGGDISTQIAFRMGAIPVSLKVANNQIPASGSVVVTPSNPSIIQSGRNVSVVGKILTVEGTLFKDANNVYTFTRTQAGSVVNIDQNIDPNFIPKTFDRDFDTVVICVGRNNYSNPTKVLSDIAAMVSLLKPIEKHFLVLPVLNGNYPAEFKGQANYNIIMNLNASIKEAYPRNFVDHRQALINSADLSNPQDVIDVQNDIVPSSLRVDDIHLTSAGYQIKAQAVYNALISNNW